jgi:hypothetical protein
MIYKKPSNEIKSGRQKYHVIVFHDAKCPDRGSDDTGRVDDSVERA